MHVHINAAMPPHACMFYQLTTRSRSCAIQFHAAGASTWSLDCVSCTKLTAPYESLIRPIYQKQ